MMPPFEHIRYAARSDLGLVRGNNEDAFGVYPAAGVFCVADGMGGGDDGEFASAETVAAVSDVCDRLKPSADAGYPSSVMVMHITMAINRASAVIARHTVEHALKTCGSTFVGVIFDATSPDTAVVVHAGDSRLYRYRNGALKRLTRDHSVAELMGMSDERDVDRGIRGAIVRAVGTQEKVELEKSTFDVQSGDRIFLCSDGLTRMVPDDRLAEILAEGSDVETAVTEMVEAAKRGGGIDNITVVLLEVGRLPHPLDVIGDNGTSSLPHVDMVSEDTQYDDRQTIEPIRGTLCLKRGLRLASIGIIVASVLAVGFLSERRKGDWDDDKVALSAAEQLAVSCDSETIRRFVRVVRLLDRHGVPDGFEEKARLLATSSASTIAKDVAGGVLLSVKSGVDYARDCAESREVFADRRTERLRRMFATLSSEVEGDPVDPGTQMRCAQLLRKIASWE